MKPPPLLLSSALALCMGCGDDPSGPEADTLTASVNSIAFASDPFAAQAYRLFGTIHIEAFQLVQNQMKSISISITNVTGPGTFILGQAQATSDYGLYSEFTAPDGNYREWIAGVEGGTGQVIINQITESHVTGSFSFNATPSAGSATGTRVVTNGFFRVTITDGEPQRAKYDTGSPLSRGR